MFSVKRKNSDRSRRRRRSRMFHIEDREEARQDEQNERDDLVPSNTVPTLRAPTYAELMGNLPSRNEQNK